MHNTISTELAILHAAEEEFIDKGFSGARTISIAQTAGVNHAMFHYYFRTKEQLFERVLASKLDFMVDSVFESLEKSKHDASLLVEIENFIRRHYEFLADNSKLPKFVINEIVYNSDRLELLKSRLLDKFATIDKSFGKKYDQSIAQGEIAAVDLLTLISDILLLNLSSIIMRPLFQHLAHKSVEEYDAWRINENIILIKQRLKNN